MKVTTRPIGSPKNPSGRGPRVWFSKYFSLDFTQFELPFVDFNLNADVPLYIDPYAITKDLVCNIFESTILVQEGRHYHLLRVRYSRRRFRSAL
jgi:hypothetical protein